MEKKKYQYHILFWLFIYLLWIVSFRSYAVSLTKTITIEFCYLIFITADYYLIAYFIIPAFLQKNKLFYFITCSLFLIAFSAFIRALVAAQMNVYFFNTVKNISFSTLYFNSVLNITIWVQVVTISKMILDKIQKQELFNELEKQKIKNELDFLKAQINPHALFNSLNTIYGYIAKDNQNARDILLQFSELLRYQLYDCSAERVSLQKEITYIKNYIGFEKLRKEEKLIVNLEITHSQFNYKIAPLMLVVLIENAFKFVSNFTHKENSISIKININNQMLNCIVSNTTELQLLTTTNNNGIGIANLKRRLALLYPQKHKLTTQITPNFYIANLEIEL